PLYQPFDSLYTQNEDIFGGFMTISEMFGQSGSLALLGMSVVFGFLIVLIIVISAAGHIIRALGLNKDAQNTPLAAQPAKIAPGGIDNALVAAITTAVKTHRNE
ncbi:MAG: OadG family protein, partial [Spirochaetaceae bacterium]|nr:OadG family protein [Spirochaetaceae bacterium]